MASRQYSGAGPRPMQRRHSPAVEGSMPSPSRASIEGCSWPRRAGHPNAEATLAGAGVSLGQAVDGAGRRRPPGRPPRRGREGGRARPTPPRARRSKTSCRAGTSPRSRPVPLASARGVPSHGSSARPEGHRACRIRSGDCGRARSGSGRRRARRRRGRPRRRGGARRCRRAPWTLPSDLRTRA